MQINFFIYLFHSNDPCFHSFIKIIVRIRIKVKDISIIFVILFLLDIREGIKNDISTSKIKNIIEIIIKFVENVIFLLLIELNPHSKHLFLSLLIFLFSIILTHIKVSAIIINRLINVSLNVNFFLFNWKLNLLYIIISY